MAFVKLSETLFWEASRLRGGGHSCLHAESESEAQSRTRFTHSREHDCPYAHTAPAVARI